MSAARLNNIDALRGIAALLVVWQHSAELFNQLPAVAAHGSALAEIAWNYDFGRIGVVCFFLISGFVIPYSFSSGQGALKKFTIRRLLRLYPAYWLSIVLLIVSAYLLNGRVFEWGTIAANITMFQKFFGEPHMLGLYWTLQIEILFYCLCAALFACGLLQELHQQALACIAFLLLSMLLSALRQIEGFENIDGELAYIPYAIAIMFSGTLLRARLLDTQTDKPVYGLAVPLLVFAQPLIILLFHLNGLNLIDEPLRFFWGHSLGLLLFVLGFYLLRFNSPWLLYLGLISYSVYLFHPIAMDIVYWLVTLPAMGWLEGWHLSLYMLLVVVATLAIATLSYRVVEKPGIDFARRLTRN